MASDDGHAFTDVDASLFEGGDLVGVVGHRPHTGDAEMAADGTGQAVIAEVDAKTKSFVGFNSVGALVLQLIGAQFVDDADTAAFFHFINDEPAAGLGDGGQGNLQLFAAIAAQAMEDVAGEALGVDPQEGRGGKEVSEGDRDGLFPALFGLPFKAVYAKVAILGRKVCLRSVL